MKKSLIIIILLIIAQSVIATNPKWELMIQTDKQEFVLYEKVLLDVTLKNITSDSIRTDGIGTPNHLGYKIIIKNSFDVELEYTGLQFVFASSGGHLLLLAGEQEYQTCNLLELFNDNNSKRKYHAPWGYFDYLPVGKYSVHVEFGGAVSNELTFTIIEPSGAELDALLLLGEARKTPMRGKTMHLAVPIFQELIDRFPNSAYAEQSYWYATRNSLESKEAQKNYTFDYNAHNLDMIAKFPNSSDINSRLRALTRGSDSNAKEEILNKVIKDFPNTRASKFATQLLKLMKKEKIK